MKDTKISDAELEILETLWAAGEALNANEIRARLNEKKDWDPQAARQERDRAGETRGLLLYAPRST